MSLLIALEEPAPAGPPVAPPAVVADALPEPESRSLSRVPLGSILSLLMALEQPARRSARCAASSSGVAGASTLRKCECSSAQRIKRLL